MTNHIAGNVIAALAVLSAAAGAQPPGFAWHRDATSIALVSAGETVWQFQYAPTLAKPMFHPVSLPGGPVLSWDQPPDHRWHHAFWFAWKYINGLNYWEEGRPREPEGLTTWRNVDVATRPDYSAGITLEIDYHPPDQPPVLRERREVQVSTPGPQGQYHFDWQSTFTAVVPVLLDRTPIPGEPQGASWGGYAGLSWRFPKDLTGWQVAFSNGDTALEPTGRRAAALEVNGAAGGVEAGVAFLDHPDNLNSPSPWHLVAQPKNSFLFAQPGVLYHGAHRLAASESLVLRYRVIVHPGRWSADRLKQEAARFTKEVRK
jgi:hypothetical protein